uniref:Uncharacterized protein n=1 Tax=Rhizophora mucronata TaxID=61149 RepID=A0A2P2R2N5_RHIMU
MELIFQIGVGRMVILLSFSTKLYL